MGLNNKSMATWNTIEGCKKFSCKFIKILGRHREKKYWELGKQMWNFWWNIDILWSLIIVEVLDLPSCFCYCDNRYHLKKAWKSTLSFWFHRYKHGRVDLNCDIDIVMCFFWVNAWMTQALTCTQCNLKLLGLCINACVCAK